MPTCLMPAKKILLLLSYLYFSSTYVLIYNTPPHLSAYFHLPLAMSLVYFQPDLSLQLSPSAATVEKPLFP